jgi:CBS domain containing-hemolysin-like protein
MKKNPITIPPSKDISEAVELMEKKNVRKLPVVVRNTVIGFITKKDILKIRPGLFDILTQKIRIAEEQEKIKRIAQSENGKEHWVKEGECQECGAQDLLYLFNDRYVCPVCKNHIKEGKQEEIEEKEQHKIAHKIFNFLKNKEKEIKRPRTKKKSMKNSKKKR